MRGGCVFISFLISFFDLADIILSFFSNFSLNVQTNWECRGKFSLCLCSLSLSLSLMGKFTWVCCNLSVQNLSGSLKNLKYEGEIMEKIEKFDSFSLFVDTCTHTNTHFHLSMSFFLMTTIHVILSSFFLQMINSLACNGVTSSGWRYCLNNNI